MNIIHTVLFMVREEYFEDDLVMAGKKYPQTPYISEVHLDMIFPFN